MGLTRYHRYSAAVIRSPRWRALRKAALERDGYRCVTCSARGRLEIDHIRPVRTHPDLAFDLGNLQSLCPSCHARKTRLELGFPKCPRAARPGPRWCATCRAPLLSNPRTMCMLDSIKISRRQSEIRQNLAGLVGKTGPTEDETRSMEALDAEYRQNETRYRAALIAEDTERREAGADLETRSDRELAELVGRFELRQAALALDEGREMTGATAEIVQELRSKGGYRGIPIPWAALERRAGETIASGTPNPIATAPIIDRIFAETVAARMGARMINIGSGEAEYPVTTSSVAAGWASSETGAVGAAAAYATTDRPLKPSYTLGIQMKLTRKAMKQSGDALEQAVRRDMGGAIGEALDAAAFLGSGSSGQPTGILAGASGWGVHRDRDQRGGLLGCLPRRGDPLPDRQCRLGAGRGAAAAAARSLGGARRHADQRHRGFGMGPPCRQHPGRECRAVGERAGSSDRLAAGDESDPDHQRRRRAADLHRGLGRDRFDPRSLFGCDLGRPAADRAGQSRRDDQPGGADRDLDRDPVMERDDLARALLDLAAVARAEGLDPEMIGIALFSAATLWASALQHPAVVAVFLDELAGDLRGLDQARRH